MKIAYTLKEVIALTGYSKITVSLYSRLGLILRTGYNEYAKISVDNFLLLSKQDRRLLKANAAKNQPQEFPRIAPRVVLYDLGWESPLDQPDPFQAAGRFLSNRKSYPAALYFLSCSDGGNFHGADMKTLPLSRYMDHLRSRRPDILIATLDKAIYQIEGASTFSFRSQEDFLLWKAAREENHEYRMKAVTESKNAFIDGQPFFFLDDPFLAAEESSPHTPAGCDRRAYAPSSVPPSAKPRLTDLDESTQKLSAFDLSDPVPSLRLLLDEAREQEQEVLDYFRECLNYHLAVSTTEKASRTFTAVTAPIRDSAPTRPGGLRTYGELEEIIQAGQSLL